MGKVCNKHLPLHNQVDHRSYEKQENSRFLPSMKRGHKKKQKIFLGGRNKGSWKVAENQNDKTTKHVIAKDTGHLWEKYPVHYHYGRSD